MPQRCRKAWLWRFWYVIYGDLNSSCIIYRYKILTFVSLSTAGIRNFLTLFLSIEVSKAMQEVVDGRSNGDIERQQYAQKMVEYFTDQMNESNPILTEISDAMTEEGLCRDMIIEMTQNGKISNDEIAVWNNKMLAAAKRKKDGNHRLMECSSRYNNLMKLLRQSRFNKTKIEI